MEIGIGIDELLKGKSISVDSALYLYRFSIVDPILYIVHVETEREGKAEFRMKDGKWIM